MIKQTLAFRSAVHDPAEGRSPASARVWGIFGARILTIFEQAALSVASDVEDAFFAGFWKVLVWTSAVVDISHYRSCLVSSAAL